MFPFIDDKSVDLLQGFEFLGASDRDAFAYATTGANPLSPWE